MLVNCWNLRSSELTFGLLRSACISSSNREPSTEIQSDVSLPSLDRLYSKENTTRLRASGFPALVSQSHRSLSPHLPGLRVPTPGMTMKLLWHSRQREERTQGIDRVLHRPRCAAVMDFAHFGCIFHDCTVFRVLVGTRPSASVVVTG